MKKQLLPCFVFFLIVSGCSESPPEIKQMDWRVVYREQGFRREELLIFLHVTDPDDESDPNEVSIIAQDTGFQWKFPRSEWMAAEYNDIKWWGMPAITPYEGLRLPDARYRVQLKDFSGKSDERSIRLKANRTKIADIEWPDVKETNGLLQYSGKMANPLLILRDENLKRLSTVPAISGYNLLAHDAAWWEIWINMENINSGIRIGPYTLP